jgi:hypothetical protein
VGNAGDVGVNEFKICGKLKYGAGRFWGCLRCGHGLSKFV